jgi:endonuclease YncB( thermonuclease family)
VELADTKGRSVGETLVADGYAVASRDASSNLLELQSTAQRERRGLWGLEPETTALWAGIPRQ